MKTFGELLSGHVIKHGYIPTSYKKFNFDNAQSVALIIKLVQKLLDWTLLAQLLKEPLNLMACQELPNFQLYQNLQDSAFNLIGHLQSLNSSAITNDHVDLETLTLGFSFGGLQALDYLLTRLRSDGAHNTQMELLAWATRMGHIKLFKHLLVINSIRNQVAADDNRLLRIAAASGQLAMIDDLLDFPSVRVQVTVLSSWALCMAAGKGHLEIFNRLIGIPKVREDVEGLINALRSACRQGQLEICNLLLDIPDVKNQLITDMGDMIGACQMGHLPVVNRLLELPWFEDCMLRTLYIIIPCACQYGYLELFNRYLELPKIRAQIYSELNASLGLAATSGQLMMVSRLLEILEEQQQRVDLESATLIDVARNGHTQVMKRFLAIGAITFQDAALNSAILFSAAKKGHSQMVYLMLEQSAFRQSCNLQAFEATLLPKPEGPFMIYPGIVYPEPVASPQLWISSRVA